VRPDFAPDLFRGTARHYLRHRPTCPRPLIDALLADAHVTGAGRLLDLACGTGQVALEMAAHFATVLAVDQEPEMVDVGEEEALRRGITNVTWRVARAEDVREPPGSVEVVTIGNAFHRLDQPLVARMALDWLPAGRCLVVMGSDGLVSGGEPWQAMALDIVRRWAERPTPAVERDAPHLTHEEVLLAAGFEDVHEVEFSAPHVWSVDDVVGHLYSTSFGSKRALGGNVEAFEAELRRALLDLDPGGVSTETMQHFYLLGRRP